MSKKTRENETKATDSENLMNVPCMSNITYNVITEENDAQQKVIRLFKMRHGNIHKHIYTFNKHNIFFILFLELKYSTIFLLYSSSSLQSSFYFVQTAEICFVCDTLYMQYFQLAVKHHIFGWIFHFLLLIFFRLFLSLFILLVLIFIVENY